MDELVNIKPNDNNDKDIKNYNNKRLDMKSLIQVYLGYCMTPLVVAQMMLWGYGDSGNNGKSTLTHMLLKMFGPFATAAPPGLLRNRHRLMILIDQLWNWFHYYVLLID